MQSLFSIAFFVFLALLAHLGIASTVYKKNLISGSLLSMLVLTSLICPLAYVNTVFIKPIIVTYLCIGFYFVFINRKIIFKIKKNEIKLFLIFLAFFLLYFRKLSPQFYIFYDHDLLYFSWIGQFLNPSVSGPIKLDISWPNQMASNHLLPGGIIAIASIFLKKQTLISSIACPLIIMILLYEIYKKP